MFSCMQSISIAITTLGRANRLSLDKGRCNRNFLHLRGYRVARLSSPIGLLVIANTRRVLSLNRAAHDEKMP
jgi:hypothetical protein